MNNSGISIPKTIWLNFRCFEFKNAIRFPIIVSSRVNIKGLRRGCICIDSLHLKPGMIRLGISDGAYDRGRYQKSYLCISEDGVLTFQGSAHVANGFSINVVRKGEIILGDNFSSNFGLILSCENKIQFGKNALLGWECTFIDGDGHDLLDFKGEKINSSREIEDGSHVWIAARVTGLKGCSIPGDSVVGYGSVVTNQICGEKLIISGYPATVIKENVTWRH